jgi:hypothetical protein
LAGVGVWFFGGLFEDVEVMKDGGEVTSGPGWRLVNRETEPLWPSLFVRERAGRRNVTLQSPNFER